MTVTVLVDPSSFELAELEVRGETYRHLFRARRMAQGDRIRVVDGLGQARWGKVGRVGPKEAVLDLGGPAPTGESRARLELVAPVLKSDRTAWLVEKATEVGVAAIHLVETERSGPQRGSSAYRRLKRVAAAAVEQCQRSFLPEISYGRSLPDLEELCRQASGLWALDPEASSDWGRPSGLKWVLLVGPEGGWTASERQLMEDWGATSVSLGARVLRSETAAIAGSATLLLPRVSVDTEGGRG